MVLVLGCPVLTANQVTFCLRAAGARPPITHYGQIFSEPLPADRVGCFNRRMAAQGLGCVKTQACCGAVEWRSQASDLLSFSREARLLAPSDAEAQKSRKLRGSHTSGARLTSCLSCYYESSRA